MCLGMWEEDSDNNLSDNALTLNLQAYGADASVCSSSEDCIDSGSEEVDGSPKQVSRKRKRSEEEEVEDGDDEDGSDDVGGVDMPDVVLQMEAEIERQLDAKAKKSNLTVANVKNILKDVITNEHVLDLVRHTMKQPERNFCISKVFSYAPKLTRAKTRELLSTFPSMAWPITPSKNISNSKCKVLIEQELPEDSSDEEYQPDKDDDKQTLDSSFCNDDQDDDDDDDDEEEQADSDAQGDEEDEEEGDDNENDAADKHELNKNLSCKNQISSNGECNKQSSTVEEDDDSDDCKLVICDNDEAKELTLSDASVTHNDNTSNGINSKNTVSITNMQIASPGLSGNKPQSRLENAGNCHHEKNLCAVEENICQRTRSKLSLSDTPLEIIESAFIPPDITTDMYDSECDDEDWKNFLKGFTEPLRTSTQDAPDDDDEETDPEYNIMAEEEVADDKEELREDPGVKVSRKEVNALMAELFEYIGMLSDDNESSEKFENGNESIFCGSFEQKGNEDEMKDIAEHIAGALKQHTEKHEQVQSIPRTNASSTAVKSLFHTPTEVIPLEHDSIANDQEGNVSNGEVCDFKLEEEEESCKISVEQKLLLEQQMRKYVQLQTQHFLLTYLHPLYHVYSMDCRQNLFVLKQHAQNNNSVFYAANLDDAITLLERWEQIHASEDSKKKYMDFMDREIELQNIMKKRKQFYRGRFPPGFFEIVCNSTVFLYPQLLPTNPFRCDGHSTTPFFVAEDQLIAIGLEVCMDYAKRNPKVWGKATVPKIVPKIVEHFLPARRQSSVYTRILECTNLENNPIKHYFQKNSAPKTIHYVIPYGKPPCQQPLGLLPKVWGDYILSKNNHPVTVIYSNIL